MWRPTYLQFLPQFIRVPSRIPRPYHAWGGYGLFYVYSSSDPLAAISLTLYYQSANLYYALLNNDPSKVYLSPGTHIY
jgi:hypothetical protein